MLFICYLSHGNNAAVQPVSVVHVLVCVDTVIVAVPEQFVRDERKTRECPYNLPVSRNDLHDFITSHYKARDNVSLLCIYPVWSPSVDKYRRK